MFNWDEFIRLEGKSENVRAVVCNHGILPFACGCYAQSLKR